MAEEKVTLKKVISDVGVAKIAKQCGVTKRAIYKWLAKGFLPRTEYTGETDYAKKISELSNGKYSKDLILSFRN